MSSQIAVGVDPGFARFGVAVVERVGGRVKLLKALCVKTKKGTQKIKSGLRVSSDDLGRHSAIYDGFVDVVRGYHVTCVGVENYQTMPGGSASAAKTLVSFGGVLWWCFLNDVFVTVSLPVDLKKRFCFGKDRSKEAVEASLCRSVVGLADVLRTTNKGDREHISDAIGHALLAFEEADAIARIRGAL